MARTVYELSLSTDKIPPSRVCNAARLHYEVVEWLTLWSPASPAGDR